MEFMKNNLGMFFGLPRLGVGVGAALLAFLVFAPVSHASVVIVDNLNPTPTQTTGASITSVNPIKAESFTASSGGEISSLSLVLNFNATAVAAINSGSSFNIYLFNAADATSKPGQPVGSPSPIVLATVTSTETGLGVSGTGTLVSGVQTFTFSLANDDLSSATLTQGSEYAVAIDVTSLGVTGANGNVSWQYISNPSYTGNPGNFLGDYAGASPTATVWGYQSTQQRQMEVDVVPEVPMTGMVIGIGALCLAGGYTLRRKLCPAKAA
jgi:hypothetical protein